MDVGGDGRILQETGRNKIIIEIFQAGKGSGGGSAGFSLLLKPIEIITDVLLRGLENICLCFWEVRLSFRCC
jgi:hypothetical protein